MKLPHHNPAAPNTMNQQRLLDFLIDRAIFGVVLFFIFIGSLLGSVSNETLKAMPDSRRYLTQIGGLLLITLIMGYLIDNFKINPYLLAGIGLFLGMGSVKTILWVADIWERSENFPDFLSNVTRIVRAFLQAYNNNIKGPGPEQKP